jgi:hypothetical protein
MDRNASERDTRASADIVSLRDGEKVFYVETEFLVPHKHMVAVRAASPEAACRLAAEVVKAGKSYGLPDFSERGAIGVVAITSEESAGGAGASRFEPVPEKYKARRNIAGVTI